MKRICVLRNTGSHLPRFTEGQVVDVPDEIAELLFGLKLAELIQTIPDEPLKAIPEKPTILATDIAPEAPLSKSKRQVKTKPESEE